VRVPPRRNFLPVAATSLFSTLQKEDGSAIVEFVLLAIPLLIPLIMYLGVVHENSTINSDLHNLARQSARAFITSSDESFEPARMQSILQIFEAKVLRPHGISEVPSLTIECSATPCLTPNSRVRVSVALVRTSTHFGGILRFVTSPTRQYVASDIQVVDAWR
jgi:Flp pilus assembly protein TadG